MSLPSSMADFVPCDRLLQKAYSVCNRTDDNKIRDDKQIGLPLLLLFSSCQNHDEIESGTGLKM